MKCKFILMCALLFLSACSELELGAQLSKMGSGKNGTQGDFKVGKPYQVKGHTYVPKEVYQHSETGLASWYGPGFEGKPTANGEIFRRNELTGAHKTLQMPSMVRVTNLDNGRSIVIRINDRGPFSDKRILDISEKAAELLDMKRTGTARVRLDVLERESRQVANAARQGVSTRGSELALNRGRSLKGFNEVAIPTAKPKSHYNSQSQMFTKIIDNPINSKASSPIYVRTGAYKSIDDALTHKLSFQNLNVPSNIQKLNSASSSELYIIKIGPFFSVETANLTKNRLLQQGLNAEISN